jgi:hypothetical protein
LSSGYRGVRARPNSTFYAEIRSGDERISLGTFETAHEVARAYDAVAWRLGRSRRSMNFDNVTTRQQAEMLTPPPPAVTREQRQRQRELEQRLVIAEHDERLRLEWREQLPEDVAAMEAFYAEKAEEKAAVKVVKKADHEERRAKKAARKKEREEKAARKAARKKEEKKIAPARRRSSCRRPLPSTGRPLRCRRWPCRLASGTPSTRSTVVLVYGGGDVISSYFAMLKKISNMFWRCILEHPAEEHFRPLCSRCNLASPVEEISPSRSF